MKSVGRKYPYHILVLTNKHVGVSRNTAFRRMMVPHIRTCFCPFLAEERTKMPFFQ
jgi:hypothetical protein